MNLTGWLEEAHGGIVYFFLKQGESASVELNGILLSHFFSKFWVLVSSLLWNVRVITVFSGAFMYLGLDQGGSWSDTKLSRMYSYVGKIACVLKMYFSLVELVHQYKDMDETLSRSLKLF
jgi:ethanolamine transporter EutH